MWAGYLKMQVCVCVLGVEVWNAKIKLFFPLIAVICDLEQLLILGKLNQVWTESIPIGC